MAAVRATLASGSELEQLMRGARLPSWNTVLDPLLEMGPLYAMDIRQDPRHQLEWLKNVNPDYLLSHTSNLELLAGILLDQPASFPRLRLVQAISETVTEAARSKIEAAFGVPLKNLYSCAEAGYVASPCPHGQGLHVHDENVLLEVLDDNDQPCQPGETGRVLITALHNFRSPFIRYDIGDQVTLAKDPCPCGRGLPYLKEVIGKQRPQFRLSASRSKHTSALVHAISAIGGHHQYHVVQKALNQVVVRVVPKKDWTTQHVGDIRQAVQAFFEAPIQVDVEICERLDLLRSGKLQGVICEVHSLSKTP